ncbi:MAG: lysozyme inhibitor LprI family protein [Vibrionaceae bacterium]
MRFLPFFSLLCVSAALNAATPCHDLDTQLEMNECASQQFEIAEKKLNITYKKVLAQLEEHRVSKFKQAQANWQNYRKAECTYQASAYQGGSIYPLIYATCLERLTTQRRSDLSQKQTPN